MVKEEQIAQGWNFGKDFFQILADIRKNHINSMHTGDYFQAIISLIDEADHVLPDITRNKDKETIKGITTELENIERRFERKKNSKRIYFLVKSMREERRKLWGIIRKYKLDHPDGEIDDPNESIRKNR